MAVADAHALPIAFYASSASRAEVTLVKRTLKQGLLAGTPKRLIGDRASVGNELAQELAQKGIALIAPHRSNRVKKTGVCFEFFTSIIF